MQNPRRPRSHPLPGTKPGSPGARVPPDASVPLVPVDYSHYRFSARDSTRRGDGVSPIAGSRSLCGSYHSYSAPELAACLRDAAFHMCPSPQCGEIILASTELPTWPCPDSELLALEALGRISKLPLRLGHLSDISYASLLKNSGPFVAHRPPICDGAGAPSSADHSLPHASGISKASKAWIQWARSQTYPTECSHILAKVAQSILFHRRSSPRLSQYSARPLTWTKPPWRRSAQASPSDSDSCKP